jgi:HK97 gp10 family phage protein
MSVTIKGDRELQRKLKALPVKLRGKALQDAANAGGKVYADSARANAPRGKTGRLQRDIKHKLITRTSDSITMGISWRTGRASRTAAFYGLFFHKGKNPRKRKGAGGSTGSMPRNRFLDKAFDESTAEANRAVADVLKRAIEQVAANG